MSRTFAKEWYDYCVKRASMEWDGNNIISAQQPEWKAYREEFLCKIRDAGLTIVDSGDFAGNDWYYRLSNGETYRTDEPL